MKTTKTYTAKRLGISSRHLDYLLNAKRNASVKLAVKLEKHTAINRTVWVFGSEKDRKKAWNEFVNSQEDSK